MSTKSLLIAVMACLWVGSPARAKTHIESKSNIAVDLPDDWKVEESKIGGNLSTTATSDDGVSIIVMRIDRKLPAEVMKRLADEMDALMKDAKASDDAEKVVVHGLQADKFSGHAKRDDVTVRFTMLLLSKDSVGTVAVIAVGSETAFKRHLRDIDAAMDSVRPKD
jgi:hypothetical protein